MKKLLVCALSAFILLTFCSAGRGEPSNMVPLPVHSAAGAASTAGGGLKSIRIEADTLYDPQRLEEVEEHSSFIVQGVLLDDAEQKLKQFGGVPYFGITVSSLQVTKVYGGNLKVGDTILLGEDYYTAENDGEKAIYHLGNYMPSTIGREYLFFLVDYPEGGEWWSGIYLPVYSEKGRYPVIGQKGTGRQSLHSLSNEDLNLGEDDSSGYRAIYSEVIAKYMS